MLMPLFRDSDRNRPGRTEERELAQTSGKCRSFSMYYSQKSTSKPFNNFVNTLYQLCISFTSIWMASLSSTSPSASEGLRLSTYSSSLWGPAHTRRRLTGSKRKRRVGAINLPPRRQAHSRQDVCHEPPKPVNHIISGARRARSVPVW